MVVKKSKSKKASKAAKSTSKAKKVVKNEDDSDEGEENEGGMDLDDAFADDDHVEYAKSKPAKIKSKKLSEDEIEDEIEEAEGEIEKLQTGINGDEPRAAVALRASKPVKSIKKGDKIRIDGKEYTVDAHYVLMNHGTTKEMAIELYDDNDKDFQLRYFDDQVEATIELYELQEIMYFKKVMQTISW